MYFFYKGICMTDKKTPASSVFFGSSIGKGLCGFCALALGGGWLYSWLNQWDDLDIKANVIIEVLSAKDNVIPSSDDLDAWPIHRQVIKKARYIQNIQSTIHPKEKQTVYGSRKDISFYDRNGWNSAILSFQNIEKKIHPIAFRQTTAKKNWSELSKRPLSIRNVETIPESILAISEGYFNEDSDKKIKGFFTNEMPKITEPYPVIALNTVQLEKLTSSKSSNLELAKKKYFIPSFDEIPLSYFENVSLEKTAHPASLNFKINESKILPAIQK